MPGPFDYRFLCAACTRGAEGLPYVGALRAGGKHWRATRRQHEVLLCHGPGIIYRWPGGYKKPEPTEGAPF